MRVILLIGMMLVSECIFADEAYVLIDAFIPGSKARQPTWIGVRKARGKFIHIPAGESIVAIKPGKYRLSHLDFQKNKASGRGTLDIPSGRTPLTFTAASNAINYFGIVDLEQTGWGSHERIYTVSLRPSKSLLEKACDKQPELFSRYPVYFPQEDGSIKKVRIRCEP